MVKFVVVLYRRPDLSRERFRENPWRRARSASELVDAPNARRSVKIPLVPFETIVFESQLSPRDVLAAVRVALARGIEIGGGITGDTGVEYGSEVDRDGFELWRVSRALQIGYFPYLRADARPAARGARILATLRPQWSNVLPAALSGLVGLSMLTFRGDRMPAMGVLALLGVIHVAFYWLTWLPERSSLVRFLGQLCQAEK